MSGGHPDAIKAPVEAVGPEQAPLTVDCGPFWVAAVQVYRTSWGAGARNKVILSRDAGAPVPFHAQSHSLEITAPAVSNAMFGRRFRLLLVEEPPPATSQSTSHPVPAADALRKTSKK